MKVGISTACYYPLETERAVERIIETGVSVAEVFINSTSEAGPAYIAELKARCDAAGLRICAFHPCTSFAEPVYFFTGYTRRLNDSLDLYRFYFEAAAQLGASVFNFHGSSPEAGESLYFEIYGLLYEEARRFGLVFSQENVVGYKSQSPAFIKAMKNALGDDVAFTLDIKQANRAGYSPFEMLDAMSGRVVHLHISDFDKKRDCLLPGQGTFDIDELMSRLLKAGYQGDAVIEVYRKNYDKYQDITTSLKKYSDYI